MSAGTTWPLSLPYAVALASLTGDQLVKVRDLIRPCGRGEEMSLKYAVIFEQAKNNWAAYVPDLPGCMTTGRTLEETERNIREAIQGHLQTQREFGEPLPEPTSLAKQIEVPPAA